MRRLALSLSVLACGFLSTAASAQDNPFGTWFAYAVDARLPNSPVGLIGELQLRSHAAFSDFDSFAARAGAQVALANTPLTLGLIYQFGRSGPLGDNDTLTTEHRLQQEARVSHRAGTVRLGGRLRLEERWVGDADLQTRGRLQASASVPFTGDGSRQGSVYGLGSAEVFLRGPGRGDRDVYDRTRVFGGLGVRATDDIGVQAGVMAQVFDDETDWQLEVKIQQRIRL